MNNKRPATPSVDDEAAIAALCRVTLTLPQVTTILNKARKMPHPLILDANLECATQVLRDEFPALTPNDLREALQLFPLYRRRKSGAVAQIDLMEEQMIELEQVARRIQTCLLRIAYLSGRDDALPDAVDRQGPSATVGKTADIEGGRVDR